MKIILREIQTAYGQLSSGRLRHLALIGWCAASFAAAPLGMDAGVAGGTRASKPRCQKVILRGEVLAGQEWRAVLGDGWVFRVMPIVPAAKESGAAAGQSYSGWDLVMGREDDAGYPDALLLATPPYGSLSEREIGTTFGMRAQDAIAWEPRRFQFFTSVRRMADARTLFREVTSQVMQGAGAAASANNNQTAIATQKLLSLISSDSKMGNGKFSIIDAKLVAGVGDPPAFARLWAGHFSEVPHTLEQASTAASAQVLGELRSIQFVATLWLPGDWKVSSRLRAEATNCAE